MKAIIFKEIGKIECVEKEIPILLDDTDVIIKILKTTISKKDLDIINGKIPSCKYGITLGHEGIGKIVGIGSKIKKFKMGDKVVVSSITSCGECEFCKKKLYSNCLNGGEILGITIDGLQSEYARIPFGDNNLHLISEDITDNSALLLSETLPSAFEIVTILSKLYLGNSIAIVGAGPIGLSMLLIAKLFSPLNIIVIDLNDISLQVAKKMGATHTINSTRENSLIKIHRITNTSGANVVFESGEKENAFNVCKKIVSPQGDIIMLGNDKKGIFINVNKDLTLITKTPNMSSIPLLIKLVEKKIIYPDNLITHEFNIRNFKDAYRTLKYSILTEAIKIAINF